MENWKDEYWETLCPKADIEVGNIFTRLAEDKITLKRAFQELEDIPNKFEDSEMANETVNKFFEHLIEDLYIEEDEAQEVFDEVREENYKKYIEEN